MSVVTMTAKSVLPWRIFTVTMVSTTTSSRITGASNDARGALESRESLNQTPRQDATSIRLTHTATQGRTKNAERIPKWWWLVETDVKPVSTYFSKAFIHVHLLEIVLALFFLGKVCSDLATNCANFTRYCNKGYSWMDSYYCAKTCNACL